MANYRKLWAALVGPAIGALVTLVDPATLTEIMAWVTPLLTAVGVYAVPNRAA